MPPLLLLKPAHLEGPGQVVLGLGMALGGRPPHRRPSPGLRAQDGLGVGVGLPVPDPGGPGSDPPLTLLLWDAPGLHLGPEMGQEGASLGGCGLGLGLDLELRLHVLLQHPALGGEALLHLVHGGQVAEVIGGPAVPPPAAATAWAPPPLARAMALATAWSCDSADRSAAALEAAAALAISISAVALEEGRGGCFSIPAAAPSKVGSPPPRSLACG